jgi:metallo-beta-lactamase class B
MMKHATIFAASVTASVMMMGLVGAGARELVGPGPDGRETLSQTYRESRMDDEAYQRSVKATKVFDNLWYVGPGYVSVWLITTPQGHVLLDSAQEPYVDHVLDNIRMTGVNLRDIKYIILAHGHLDHFGGAARLQEATGARVVLSETDWAAVEATGSRPGRGGAPPPRVPKRDYVVKHGETIALGGNTFKVYHTPGHTPGAISVEYTVYDNGRPHKAFWSGGSGGRGGLEGAEQALATAIMLKRELQGVEVSTPAHAWTASTRYQGGSIFERFEVLKQPRRPGQPHAFVDKAAFDKWLNDINQNAIELVAEEKAKLAATPANAPAR